MIYEADSIDNELTAFDLQRTDLPVHRKIREIHGTACCDCQPVHYTPKINNRLLIINCRNS